jgi:hypothetical protein
MSRFGNAPCMLRDMARLARAMRAFGLCSVIVVTACGKGSPPPESAADGASEGEPVGASESSTPSAEGEERDDGVKETGKLKSSSGGPTATSQSGNDQQAILQIVIDDPELEPYLKLGEPGRFPLKLSGSAVPQGIELTKSTKPVVFVAAAKDKTDPVLVVTSFEVQGNTATVSYRYDVEGIRGTASLKKGELGWELSRSRVVEHYAK